MIRSAPADRIMAARPPALMVELIEEVLLRFPPTDPASLVRAALVCKEWCRIVGGPGFRRRFRELHRTPPMLGVICDLRILKEGEGYLGSGFIPTSPCPHHHADHYGWYTLDARHGCVLCCIQPWIHCLEVWDPVTGRCQEVLNMPCLDINMFDCNAAVLCAAHGACDHLDCHHGFLVVLVDSATGNIRVHVYSSEADGWSEPIYSIHSANNGVIMMPPALAGNALYFLIDGSKGIFKYELSTQNMSIIQLPSDFTLDPLVLTLTTMDDDGLGLASLEDPRLDLWSMETGPEEYVGWAKIRVIQLQMLLPVNVTISYGFVSFAHGIGLFLVGTKEGLFSIELKSQCVRKLCNEACGVDGIQWAVPFMSFYIPDLRQHGLVAA